jgi:hypothetical protein
LQRFERNRLSEIYESWFARALSDYLHHRDSYTCLGEAAYTKQIRSCLCLRLGKQDSPLDDALQ